ncbi:CAAX prenyl protease-like protein [Geodermatophilus normandii]|uniref:CAAX prenyl protease-like protein n=1 Tax=Geodermatophilus normandii TaxID=1137989 RepID=A0A317QMD9_9ACTN|nr:CPBP family glutamic-type intramembrane protease [Geodermatophilus normandii]PWW24133.1 CAAX prenyl protease-like protein [Geodermatophilus normandii]
MDGRAARRRLGVATAGLCVGLLAWNTVVVPALPGRPASAVAANAGATVLLLAAARWWGLSWAELGLARRRLPAGARWGGVSAALVLAAYAGALAVPALRPLLADARVAGLDGPAVAVRALVRVPLGTVAWEEVAFRGVLLAAACRLLPLPAATALSCAVFGLWHVRPALRGLDANAAADAIADDAAGGLLGTGTAVVLTCLGTAAAGLLFTWLRLRSGSLLAPALLHLATNSLGVLAAAAATRAG